MNKLQLARKQLLDGYAKLVKAGKEPVFTDEIIRLGSMYFATSNLGMDDKQIKTAEDIKRAYAQCDMACAEGTGDIEGPGAEPERKAWVTSLKTGRGRTAAEKKAERTYFRAELFKECPFLWDAPTAQNCR